MWLIESGNSSHMTGRKKLFHYLDDSIVHKVRLGDDKEFEVLRKKSVAVQVQGDQRKLIHGVKYVPNLAHNLLSVGQLLDSGYQAIFSGKSCLIHNANSGKVLMKVCRNNNNLFPIEFGKESQQDSVNEAVVDKKEMSILWHRRFGHLDSKSLFLLNQKQMVKGLPRMVKVNGCEAYIYGKSAREVF